MIYLITGGTGSLGRQLVKDIGQKDKIIVYSRDEFKQSEMAKEFNWENLRFFIGDVRDKDRLKRAMENVDYVVHAAALKQIPALEYNPIEAVRTNIDGTANVLEACVDCKVKKAIFISSDKAVNPINIYGATKLAAEKLWMAANSYANWKPFSCVRYGNVVGSRGSVIPLFQKLIAEDKQISITHPDMTRFWITLREASQLVRYALNQPYNAIYVPLLGSMKITDLALSLGYKDKFKFTGMRAGEKLHETLVAEWEQNIRLYYNNGSWPYDKIGAYTSKNNDRWINLNDFKRFYL